MQRYHLNTGIDRLFTMNTIILQALCILLSCAVAQFHGITSFEFYAAFDRLLNGTSYETARALSAVGCVRSCHADTKCLSVNYLENEHLCELNNARRTDTSSPQFIIQYGSTYYDSDKDTLGYSRSLLTHPRSCKERLKAGNCTNGLYTIFPSWASDEGIPVLCDMETDGGGWIVVQRRYDGSVDFDRNWEEYRRGSGSLAGEFWLGNDYLRDLTETSGPWQLRVELEDNKNNSAFSQYEEFSVSGEKYLLHLGSFNAKSTAGDILLAFHNNMYFTTKDYDNDSNNDNCATRSSGGWWYMSCGLGNINAKYVYNNPSRWTDTRAILWFYWPFYKYPHVFKTTSLKIREMP